MIKKILKNIKYIKVKDIIEIISLPIIFIVASIYKIYLKIINKKIWLIAEGKNDARDNGYVFFKYIRKNYPQESVYYAINKKSEAFQKVKELGNTINYGSLKHWIYYLTASKNISIHKSASPNEKIFYILHYYRIVNGHRVFLQHGITMNYVKYLTYKETNFELFICGAKPEYEYIKQNFGYPKENVCYLGFPRFDNLFNIETNKKQIALFPTWRSWLKDITEEEFKKTDYFLKYQSLLNNTELVDYLEKEKITLCFYLHKNVERFVKTFSTKSNNIKIIDSDMSIILELIRDSSIIITDYSSISLDGAYMKKPIIYYQFDEEKFRKEHLHEGYFSYKKDGFGPVIKDEEELINKIITYCNNDYQVEQKYVKKIDSFFEIRDDKNCERIFKKIKNMD